MHDCGEILGNFIVIELHDCVSFNNDLRGDPETKPEY